MPICPSQKKNRIDESDELANESLVVHPHTQIPEIHIDELMSDVEGGGSENDEEEDTQMLGTNTQDVSPSQILYSAKGIVRLFTTSRLPNVNENNPN
jgi:hypothetical protein